jgi:sortase A
MRKIISTILILLGIIVVSLPSLNRQIIKYNTNKNKELIRAITNEQLKENDSLEAEFDYDSIQDIEIISTIKDRPKFNYKSMVGEIKIDSIDMHLPILKGVNNPNLLAGAATMKDNIKMGEGNYSLAGHYADKEGILFGGLIDIEIGSIVKITDKEYIYEYIIYDTKIVPETALYMLDNSMSKKRGKPIISLMSCYYTSKNGKRFFALGELKDKYPYEIKGL